MHPVASSIGKKTVHLPIFDRIKPLNATDCASFVKTISKEIREGMDCSDVTPSLKLKKYDGRLIFGMHKDTQESADFSLIKSKLLEQLEIAPDTPVFQVVGDSAPYDEEGTLFGQEIVNKLLDEEKFVTLYGYTGHTGREETKDVNQLVSDWIDADPESRASRSIGNVVNYHTPTALTSWRCTGSEMLQNFFLVYGDDESSEKGAKFGDDVIASDFITDKVLCLEGGIQSFRQILNCLAQDRKAVCVYGMRGDKNKSNRARTRNNDELFTQGSEKYYLKEGRGHFVDEFGKDTGHITDDPKGKPLYNHYFSAAEFLAYLRDEVEKREEMNEAEFKKIWNEYMKERYAASPFKPDYSTKQALLEKALPHLTKEKLWEKLHLCTFIPCPRLEKMPMTAAKV